MDALIAEYANRLERIYTARNAGDHTFTGVLADFARDVQAELAPAYEDVDYVRTPECGE